MEWGQLCWGVISGSLPDVRIGFVLQQQLCHIIEPELCSLVQCSALNDTDSIHIGTATQE